MTQCNICNLSFADDEGLATHKTAEHKSTDKAPTLAETSAQLIREQAAAHAAGQDASFGYGIGDPVAASANKPVVNPTATTTAPAKKPGEK